MGFFSDALSGIGDIVKDTVKTVAPAAPLVGAVLGGPAGYAAGSLLGGALGGSGQTVSGGLSTLGGVLQGNAAQQANQQAAQMTQFRPVGITNTFGTSNFQFDPTTGQLTSAGYQLSPSLQAIQDYVMGNTRQGLGDVTALQNLGRGYLAQTPQQAAADWMSKQQALLQPSRDVALANLQNRLQQTGRGGLSIAQGGTLGASNPELQAYYNSIAQQNAQLAAQGMEQGRQQTLFGQGLLSSAYQPLTAGLTAAGTVEGLGMQPLELSSSLAGRTATAGATAAPYLKAATSYNPWASILGSAATNQPFTNALSGLFSGFGGTPQGAYGQQDQYLAGAMSNPQTQQAQMLAAQMAGFDTTPQLSWYE